MPELKRGKIMLIWEFDDKIYTKGVDPLPDTIMTKVNGRKPTKIIVPAELVTDEIKRLVKKSIAHHGVALSTTGEPIYDRRIKQYVSSS